MLWLVQSPIQPDTCQDYRILAMSWRLRYEQAAQACRLVSYTIFSAWLCQPQYLQSGVKEKGVSEAFKRMLIKVVSFHMD